MRNGISFLLGLIGIVLAGAAVAGGLWHVWQLEEYTVVDITAAQDTLETTQPVFAQFVVTQLLTIEEPVTIDTITVPLWSGATGADVTFSLLRNNKLVHEWAYQTVGAGQADEAILLLDPPRLVDGALALRIAAPTIEHDAQELAPRVFIETADEHYPAGHYKIAENDKRGDVAMRVDGQRRRLDRLLAGWRAEPLSGVRDLGLGVMVAMVLAALPSVPLRWWRHRSGRRSAMLTQTQEPSHGDERTTDA